MLAFFRYHWFLIALTVVLGCGLNAGSAVVDGAAGFPKPWLIAAVLFTTALPVDLSRMASARGVWLAIGLAVALSTIAAPLLGFAASWFLPAALGPGLFAVLASPCTMASAAVWTRRGKGNDAVALAVTLITSLACFVVLPAWTWLLLGESVPVAASSLAMTLLACVAIPVAAAQGCRRSRPVAAWADGVKPWLSLLGQLGVLGMVLLGAIGAGSELRSLGEPIPMGSWLAVLAAALSVHVALLLAGWRIGLASGLGRPEAVAVAIAGSQKTLAVGVGVAAAFGPLALLPMIAYHVVQLVVDTLFADRVRDGLEESASGA